MFDHGRFKQLRDDPVVLVQTGDDVVDLAVQQVEISFPVVSIQCLRHGQAQANRIEQRTVRYIVVESAVFAKLVGTGRLAAPAQQQGLVRRIVDLCNVPIQRQIEMLRIADLLKGQHQHRRMVLREKTQSFGLTLRCQ